MDGISFQNSDVPDDVFKHLGNCKQLTGVSCNGCKELTDQALAHLATFRRLRTLNVSGAKITDVGVAHLAGLTELETVDLSDTRITGRSLDTLKNCKHIVKLLVGATDFTDEDLGKLTSFPMLKNLTVDSSQLTARGTKHLANLSALDRLTVVSDSGWTGEPLQSLPDMPRLSLLFHATDEQLRHAASMKGLKELNVTFQNSVTDQGLAFLANSPSLETLTIQSTNGRITDAGLKHLESLTTLKTFNLSGVQVTAAGMDSFKRKRPDCTISFETVGQSPTSDSRPTDEELLQRLTALDWKPGTFESDLYGCVAAPATIDGIPADWQLLPSGVGGSLSRSGKYILRGRNPTMVIDARTGKCLNSFPTPKETTGFNWSYDDEYIAYIAGNRLHIQHREAVTRHEIVRLRFSTGVTPAWAPDNRTIAVVGHDGNTHQMQLFSATGVLLREFEATSAWYTHWSPDGNTSCCMTTIECPFTTLGQDDSCAQLTRWPVVERKNVNGRPTAERCLSGVKPTTGK